MKVQLKRFLKKSKAFFRIDARQTLLFFVLLLMAWSCTQSRKATHPLPHTVSLPVEKDQNNQQASPRETAALQLTEQGRIFLEEGSLDSAISLLERAISLSPANGCICYYLAEAWLGKGDQEHAREFNRLAGLYLDENTEWLNKIREQKKKIESSEVELP